MLVYKTLTQPSVVTDSVSCHFTGEDNLVTVHGNSLLKIYRFISTKHQVVEEEDYDQENAQVERVLEGQDSFVGTEVTLQPTREEFFTKLVLVAERPLDGFVTHIGKIRTLADPDNDYLLISFKHAKMVLIAWDSIRHDINTVSLHYYEKDLHNSHFVDLEFSSYFRTDPRSNCACMVYQHDCLAFLPFQQDDLLDDANRIDRSRGGELPLYFPSFLVESTKLEASIANVIDLSFLYEYREPTLAIIFQPTRTWTGTLPLHSDTVRYLVLSLDLQQRSSTPITSVQGLPYDIQRIVPLPDPIRGSLLIGMNHLIHIDTSGAINGVAVNPISSKTTKLKLTDQTDLNIQLGGSRIVFLKGTDGQLLMILQSGDICLVTFNIEGRKVYGFEISRLESSNGGDISIPFPSTVSLIGPKSVFIGSRTSKAVVLSWKRKGEKDSNVTKTEVSIYKPRNDDMADLDDIYGEFENDGNTNTNSNSESLNGSNSSKVLQFQVHDSLECYGPIHDLAVGTVQNSSTPAHPAIIAATGMEKTGALSIFHRNVVPKVSFTLKLEHSLKIWSLSTRNPGVGGISSADDTESLSIVNYCVSTNKSSSTLFSVTSDDFEEISSDFVSKVPTIGLGTVGGGAGVIQIAERHIYLYSSSFNLLSTIKLPNEAYSASVIDSFVQILLKTGDVVVYTSILDTSKESQTVRQVVLPDLLQEYASCANVGYSSVLNQQSKFKISSNGLKRKRNEDEAEVENEVESSRDSFGLLLQNDTLIVYSLARPAAVLLFNGITRLLSDISSTDEESGLEAAASSDNSKSIDIIDMALVLLGDETFKEEYLALLTSTNELYLYLIYIVDDKVHLSKVLNLPQIAALRSTESDDSSVKPSLKQFQDASGYSFLLLTGDRPYIVIKTAASAPRIHPVGSGPILSAAPFNTESIFKGIAYLTGDEVSISILSNDIDYSSVIPARKIQLGETISTICYHQGADVYVVSTLHTAPYNAVDEDSEPIPGLNEELPRAQGYRGSIKMISPQSWTVIDQVDFEENEAITCLKTVVLEVSERAKRKKELIAVGISNIRGEDLAAKGSYHVFDIIQVVPEPGKPETSHKLKIIAHESLKGAVSSLCEVDGHLLVAQGQKVRNNKAYRRVFNEILTQVVVRNLTEDNSIMPVAFLDINLYLIEAKSLNSMLLLGDAMRGAWFVGFGVSINYYIDYPVLSNSKRDPYRMVLFGKDYDHIEVSCADFAVSGENLYMAVADIKRKIHILQYDPENPASLSGQKLLRRSEFFTGKLIQTMKMIPVGENSNQFMPLAGAEDGSLIVLVPMSESSYRSLYVIQQQIIDKNEHNASLNPRMHRSTEVSFNSQDATVSRSLLDYDVISRFQTLSVEEKNAYSRKAGKNGQEEVWNNLQLVENSLSFL